MPAIPIKLRFGRVLSHAGSAGTRRLVLIGAGLLVLGCAAAMVVLRDKRPEQTTMIAKVPRLDPLPGGPNTTPAYTDLANRADQARTARAIATNNSSVATMPGRTRPDMVQADELPAPEVPKAVPAAPRVAPAPVATAPQQVTPAAAPPQPTATTAAANTARRQADDEQAKVYQAAIGSLLAGWGDKAQQTEVILPAEDRRDSAASDTRADRDTGVPTTRPSTPAAYAPASTYAPLANGRTTRGRVLMPAGRGIYARTVLAASSDQGGPVVIEALSGPIVGSRMTGTFETHSTRMVVHLTSITLRDGTQQKINAMVIAPDTLETSVASSVDQHYISRFVLPVAAAFVSGLGQAISQSNSTIVASPLGGATAFQRLNLDQQLGVAAGAAANQFGAAVTAAAPKGPTVNLDANVNVGVMFLEPLVVGGEP